MAGSTIVSLFDAKVCMHAVHDVDGLSAAGFALHAYGTTYYYCSVWHAPFEPRACMFFLRRVVIDGGPERQRRSEHAGTLQSRANT